MVTIQNLVDSSKNESIEGFSLYIEMMLGMNNKLISKLKIVKKINRIGRYI